MVPYEAETTVEAVNEKAAIEIARARFKDDPRKLLAANSGDESSAWDWCPSAEEIEQ